MDFKDILYEERAGVARITINRPNVMNAFRGQTVDELIAAFLRAGWKRDIGVIVLAGAGEKAFAPAATSRRTTASTTGAAPSACPWRSCTA
jgi:1,4-dihydroxy-2-naphthoyl-CoA synthase